MTIATTVSPTLHEPQLLGQTVVVIGGSSGIGLETARRARAEGANVVITGRNPERLQHAALELDARSSAAFDATDFDRLERFFGELPTPVDHVMITAGGPYYARLTDIDFEQARRTVDQHLWLPLHVARNAAAKVRPGGTLLFTSGTGGRRPAVGMALSSALTALSPRSRRRSPSSSRPSVSISSRPASSTHHCLRRCLVTDSTNVATNSARRYRSAAWSAPPTSQHSPSIS